MARVILAPFISSISGKVGNLEFRTLKSGKTTVRVCRKTDYQISRTLTHKEIEQRRRFGIVSSIVAEIQSYYPRIDEAALDRKRIWQKVSYLYAKFFESISDDAELRQKIIDNYSATETRF